MSRKLSAAAAAYVVVVVEARGGREAAYGPSRRHFVEGADVARLSPWMRCHINFHGRYSFALSDLRGARRALRDLDAPSD
jgi:hypothetical protein